MEKKHSSDIIPPPGVSIRREGPKAIHTDTRRVYYKDTKWKGSNEEYIKKVENSATVYIGNVNTRTREEELFALFSKCGTIKNVIMGLDRYKKTPCGFCFVIYETVSNAQDAVRYLNDTKLCGSIIRVDKDQGYFEGRQYGRGKKGGQMRDDFGRLPTTYRYHHHPSTRRNLGGRGGRRGRDGGPPGRRRGFFNQRGGRSRGRKNFRGRGGGRPKSRVLELAQFQPMLEKSSTPSSQDNNSKIVKKKTEISQIVQRPPDRNVTGRKRKMRDREDVEIEEWEKRRRKRRKRLEENDDDDDSSSSGSDDSDEEKEFRKRKRKDSEDSDDEDM